VKKNNTHELGLSVNPMNKKPSALESVTCDLRKGLSVI